MDGARLHTRNSSPFGAAGWTPSEITHLPLIGIRPEMLAWWYQKLPVSSIDIHGIRYTLYHVFHPSEHGRIRVTEPANDGTPGMGVGALVERDEWFGPFDSKGAGRITQLSAAGMTVVPEVAGLQFGEIQHIFEATPTGSQYRVVSVIGVEWPLIGRVVNALIRHKMYPEVMIKEWERHQIEEVGMLQHFLPALYNSEPKGDLYSLPPSNGRPAAACSRTSGPWRTAWLARWRAPAG